MTMSQNNDDSNRLSELNQLESIIVNILNTIKTEKFKLGNGFFHSMEYMNTHLLHMPDFYSKQIKHIFANKNGELNSLRCDRVVIAYGAHKEIYGN